MSEEFFPGFGKFLRPDIGLVSDGFSNLAEIFSSDKRSALRNIGLDPETLDSLYGTYQVVSREDLRSSSGLDRLLLPSLNQLSEVFLNRIPTPLFISKEYYSSENPLGGSSGSPQVKSENIILLNGSVQCESVNYRANVVGDSIFGPPFRQDITMSTSRASLFNSEMETSETLLGYFKSVKYSGSIRVRRRSHVNRIVLPKTNFLSKSQVPENPTHTLTLNLDKNNSGTPSPVKLLTTKNTPLKLYGKMAIGVITLKFTEETTEEDKFFYGVQVQPAQQRPNSPVVDFLTVAQELPDAGVKEFTSRIDITSTGYQNLYNLYLYVYVNPEKIEGIEISGIDLREFPDQKDIGLIGFNNLKTLRIVGGSISTLPLWLKTLKSKLQVLDLSQSGDAWRSGPMGWFDIRNPEATISNISGTGSSPLYTVVSYLTIPKRGVFLNEEGDDWSDDVFRRYLRNEDLELRLPHGGPSNPGDYRVFSAMETLILGDRFYGRSPRLDDVFPNLRVLNWSQPEVGPGFNRNYQVIFGSPPKVANNGQVINYNIAGSGASGSIEDIGTSTDFLQDGHISKYKFSSFNISGKHLRKNSISGYINNPSDGSDWSSWRNTCTSINIARTDVSINIQDGGPWRELTSLNLSLSGGLKFKEEIVNFNSSPILAPKLQSLTLFETGSSGYIPSLGTAENTSELVSVSFGGTSSISLVEDNGLFYMLPANFAEFRNRTDQHKLSSFSASYFPSPSRLRYRDFVNLPNLYEISLEYSSITGVFPFIPPDPLAEQRKSVIVRISDCNLYNISSLSINQSSPIASQIFSISSISLNGLGGGCIPMDLTGVGGSVISVLDIGESLSSVYPANWNNPDFRDSCIKESDPPTVLEGLTLNEIIPESSTDPADIVYTLTGLTNLNQFVLVNDVIKSEAGEEFAYVLSVRETEIVVSNGFDHDGPLVFHRRTVDISSWFKFGFSELRAIRASNCRLSGKLSISSGFSKVQDDSLSAIVLRRNLISSYEPGLFKNRIFSGGSRRITIDLSYNNFSLAQIRSIISEISEVDSSNRFRNCRVLLSRNKLSDSSKYIDYTQQEIFPTTIKDGPVNTVLLSRNEQFQVFTPQQVIDPDLNATVVYRLTTNRNIQVPGAYFESLDTYYKKTVQQTQVIVENELAPVYKKLSGIKIDLGFSYVSPSSLPFVVYSENLEETTRIDSITEIGLTKLDACPSGISAGFCWRNSSGQILRLNS